MLKLGYSGKTIPWLPMPWFLVPPGLWFNIKMSSYQYTKSHCGDKTILRPSYLHNGISYTGKTTSLYWRPRSITSMSLKIIVLELDISLPGANESIPLLHINTRTTRMPVFWGYPPASWLPILLSHIGSQVKRRQSQSYKFKEFAKSLHFQFRNKLYMRHTFWSCLIRCANIKCIRWVLLKIQSTHDSVHRQTDGRTTDGQTEGRTRWNQYTPLTTSLKWGV